MHTYDTENEPFKLYRPNNRMSLPDMEMRRIPPSDYVPEYDGPPGWVFIAIIAAGIVLGIFMGWENGLAFVGVSFMGMFWVSAMEAILGG